MGAIIAFLWSYGYEWPAVFVVITILCAIRYDQQITNQTLN